MVGKIVCAEEYVDNVRKSQADFNRKTIARISKEMNGYKEDLGANGDEGIAIPGGFAHTKAGLRIRIKLVLLKIERLVSDYRPKRTRPFRKRIES